MSAADEAVVQLAVIGQATPPRRRIRWRRHFLGYAFISPWIVGFVIFIAGPMAASVYLSLTDYDLLSSPRFAGFENFERLARDPSVPKALFNTAYYTFISVPAKLAV
ncbi:MAG: sugar ABC transporter permease, partial [Chloroflexi bacterium]|nr:sugar ABC transporter permease [Chloroflexota bacterium]